MASSSFLFALLVFWVTLVDSATVEETCNSAQGNIQGFNLQLCIDSISNDPINPGTDLELQAAAGANQAKLKADDAWNQASLPSRDSAVATALKRCLAVYDDMRTHATTAVYLLQNPIKVPARVAAREELIAGRDRGGECADAFTEAGKPSPITNQSRDCADMFVIAVAVLSLLIP